MKSSSVQTFQVRPLVEQAEVTVCQTEAKKTFVVIFQNSVRVNHFFFSRGSVIGSPQPSLPRRVSTSQELEDRAL